MSRVAIPLVRLARLTGLLALSCGGALLPAGGGESCRVAQRTYASGTTGIPAGSGCGTCSCEDGEISCTDQACSVGMPVFECPEKTSSDLITVLGSELVGSALTLEVGHGGGCKGHDYGLCYGPEFLDSYPVQVGLTLIHDAHGDSCEAYLTRSLVFDLGPLAAAFERSYRSPGGLVSTTYGLYAFGDASCEERTRAAIDQARRAAANAQTPCSTDDQCEVSYPVTICSPGCGRAISRSRTEHLDSVLTLLETEVCGNFEVKGCQIQVAPCVPPPPVRCVEGRCVEAGIEGPESCTPGADQTCNDDPRVSALWGRCERGVCRCNAGFEVNPSTGRCRPDSATD